MCFRRNKINKYSLLSATLLLSNLISGIAQMESDVVLNSSLMVDTYVQASNSIKLAAGFSSNGYVFDSRVIMDNFDTFKIPHPGTDYNYLMTITPTVPISKDVWNTLSDDDPNNDIALEYGDAQVSVDYFDGIGRRVQTIAVGNTPDKKDLISFVQYDLQDKINKEYLPYPFAANGEFRDDAVTEQAEYYYGKYPQETRVEDAYGEYLNGVYTQYNYDGSSLKKLYSKGGPGLSWLYGIDIPDATDSRAVRYHNYPAQEAIPHFKIDDYTDLSINTMLSGTINYSYEKGALSVSEVIDEDGQVRKAYTDKRGNIVLKEAFLSDIEKTRTLYIYDSYGLLRCVVPPQASDYSDTSYCYYYGYDSRHRMTEKKIPGASIVNMVYDNHNRLVLSQDGELRKNNKWLFTKYDVLNRPVMTGSVSITSLTFEQLCDALYNYSGDYFENAVPTGNIGYSLNNSFSSVFSVTESNVLTLTYYDNYNMLTVTGFSGLGFEPVYGYDQTSFDKVKGLTTGTKVKVLNGDEHTASALWLCSVNYYDDKYRAIQTRRDILGSIDKGTETITSDVDFVGKTEKRRQSQILSGKETVVNDAYSYDHAGRLISKTQDVCGNQSAVNLAYNELGQLIQEEIGGGIQTIDYAYNVKGWLTNINNPDNLGSDLFAMNLRYNDVSGLTNVATKSRYNGNIAAMTWINSYDRELKAYGYTYDNLNRLKTADYETYSSGWSNTNKYDVTGIGYDKNGNILALNRYSGSSNLIDSMVYQYNNTNQLKSAEDYADVSLGFVDGVAQTTEYSYDRNGNMKQDLNKSISSISYNYLNLPKSIVRNSNTSTYTYSALGEKLLHNNGAKTKIYCSNFVYENNGAGDELKYILFDKGRVIMNDSVSGYEYYIKDHLGNTRVTLDETGQVLQVADYYPFGMRQEPIVELSTDNNYLYNGKELQEDVDWYDYGARMYDPSLGRWMVIDKIADAHHAFSPYNYALNNPINVIDPDGNIPWPVVIEGRTYGPRTGGNAFGMRIHPIKKTEKMHKGIDLGYHPEHGNLQGGEGIRSLARGTVVEVGNSSSRGNYVVIDHGSGYKSIYMHIQDDGTYVKQGQEVGNGDVIAAVGSTGWSTGPHLHLSLTKDGENIDPTSIEDLDVLINGSDGEEGLSMQENIEGIKKSWKLLRAAFKDIKAAAKEAKNNTPEGQKACAGCELKANMDAYDDYINTLNPEDNRMSYDEFIRENQEKNNTSRGSGYIY